MRLNSIVYDGETMENPMVSKSCLHRFCCDCINQALRGTQKECPVCREVYKHCQWVLSKFDTNSLHFLLLLSLYYCLIACSIRTKRSLREDAAVRQLIALSMPDLERVKEENLAKELEMVKVSCRSRCSARTQASFIHYYSIGFVFFFSKHKGIAQSQCRNV